MDASTDATYDNAFASVAADQRFQAVITFTNNSLEFAVDRWHNKDSTNFRPMQRYSITTPLVAVRLFQSHETEKAGVMTTLPPKAVVEVHGPSDVGNGMVEVAWERCRYAVFERDLKVRGSLVRTAAVGD
jgi:hypothetical protein